MKTILLQIKATSAMTKYALRSAETDGVLYLDVEEITEITEEITERTKCYIQIAKIQPLLNERTTFTVHIPTNATTHNLLMACKTKFHIKSPRIYSMGKELKTPLTFNCDKNESSFVILEFEDDKPRNNSDTPETCEAPMTGENNNNDKNQETNLTSIRGRKMREAAEKSVSCREECNLSVFVRNQDDKDWERKVARKDTMKSSAIYKNKRSKMSVEVTQAVNEGEEFLPMGSDREITGTWDVLKYTLPKVVIKYQQSIGKPLHYANFFSFESEELIELQDPSLFLNQMDGINADSMSNFLTAHQFLWSKVVESVDSSEGNEKYKQRFEGEQDKLSKAAADQDRYVRKLERIKNTLKRKETWLTIKKEAHEKRLEMEVLKQELLTSPNAQSKDLKEAVDIYLSSALARETEDTLISNSQEGSGPLQDDAWIEITRHLVLRIQIVSGSRTSAPNMTMLEWRDRQMRDDGNVLIERTFSKVEKDGTATIVVLGPIEYCLLLHYEAARKIKFPSLDDQNLPHQIPFFVNSCGNEYMGKKGNKCHLVKWIEITGRVDTVTEFRKNMANWSLTTDQVTRANTAFVNNHSPEIMTKIYAKNQEKRQKGIDALLQYRLEGLNQNYLKTASVFTVELPKDMLERQTRQKIECYESALQKIIQHEQNHHKEQHNNLYNKHASTESRAALLEAITAERLSGNPVNPKRGYLVDRLLIRPKPKDSKVNIIEHILQLLDSPRFENNSSICSLINILIRAASQIEMDENHELDDFISIIEDIVVNSWIMQIDNLARPGSKLIEYRNFSSFCKLSRQVKEEQKSTKQGDFNTLKYCLSNKIIETQIKKMIETRDSLETGTKDENCGKKTITSENLIKQYRDFKEVGLIDNNNEVKEKNNLRIRLYSSKSSDECSSKDLTSKKMRRKSVDVANKTPEKAKIQEEKPRRESPRLKFSTDQNPSTPSPIKLRREPLSSKKPHWNKEERTKLLEHILKNMTDPTLPYRQEGMNDLEENVFKKVSPMYDEQPELSRTKNDIIEQYYR